LLCNDKRALFIEVEVLNTHPMYSDIK
jgi:hypothetical protein